MSRFVLTGALQCGALVLLCASAVAAPPLAPLSLEGDQSFHVGEDFRVTLPAGFRQLEAKETKRASHLEALKGGALILVPDEKGACCEDTYPAVIVTRIPGGITTPSAETCERNFEGTDVRSLQHVDWNEVRELPGCRSRYVHPANQRPTTRFLFGGPRKGWSLQCDDGPMHDLASTCEEVARSFVALHMGRVAAPGFSTVRPMGFREADPSKLDLGVSQVVSALVEWPLDETNAKGGVIHFRGIGVPAAADMKTPAGCGQLLASIVAQAGGAAAVEAVRWEPGDACRVSLDSQGALKARLVYTVLRPRENIEGERRIAFQVSCMMRDGDPAAPRACSQVLEHFVTKLRGD